MYMQMGYVWCQFGTAPGSRTGGHCSKASIDFVAATHRALKYEAWLRLARESIGLG